MSEGRCEFCGATDPRWLRSIDRSIVDYAARTIQGYHGPTSYALRYCDRTECEEAAERDYPAGNDAALARLEADVARRGLDADDNEVRFLALILRREGRA